jgi:hypothetical protein
MDWKIAEYLRADEDKKDFYDDIMRFASQM